MNVPQLYFKKSKEEFKLFELEGCIRKKKVGTGHTGSKKWYRLHKIIKKIGKDCIYG